MKTLIPWLVTEKDLSRHLGRALDMVDRGRPILCFHYCRAEKRTVLLALAPEENWQEQVAAAREAFREGRFRPASLADISRTNRQHRGGTR